MFKNQHEDFKSTKKKTYFWPYEFYAENCTPNFELTLSLGFCFVSFSEVFSGSNSLSSTWKRKNIKPYSAGPKPLHSPLTPVIIPWTTPNEENGNSRNFFKQGTSAQIQEL